MLRRRVSSGVAGSRLARFAADQDVWSGAVSVGFVLCERYYDTPLADTVFMELVLSDSP